MYSAAAIPLKKWTFEGFHLSQFVDMARCIYIYKYIHTCIYTCIDSLHLRQFVDMAICIYIYKYIHTYIYIYMYR